jgi:hypothetical protein
VQVTSAPRRLPREEKGRERKEAWWAGGGTIQYSNAVVNNFTYHKLTCNTNFILSSNCGNKIISPGIERNRSHVVIDIQTYKAWSLYQGAEAASVAESFEVWRSETASLNRPLSPSCAPEVQPPSSLP